MEREGLVAPCGMYCGVCSHYLAYSRNLPRQRGRVLHCIGCRPRGKLCAFLKGRCEALKDGKVEFCHECNDSPCMALKALDRRYRHNYRASLIGNLERIRQVGIESFAAEQDQKYLCRRCGGTVSIHNGRCYDCEEITSWRPTGSLVGTRMGKHVRPVGKGRGSRHRCPEGEDLQRLI